MDTIEEGLPVDTELTVWGLPEPTTLLATVRKCGQRYHALLPALPVAFAGFCLGNANIGVLCVY